MSNTSLGRGIKGSKYWMQAISNLPSEKKKFDKLMGDTLEWISPLKSDDYREYSLNAPEIAKSRLGIDEVKQYFKWWPSQQPQWDGLAIGNNHTLYIIEAKAHLSELESKCSATSEENRALIYETMSAVQRQIYPEAEDFERDWINGYYQLGNRLTFLEKLKEAMPPEINDVKLVLLNFVDDYTYISTPEYDWIKHYEEVWEDMTGKKKCPEDIKVVYYSVKGLSGEI